MRKEYIVIIAYFIGLILLRYTGLCQETMHMIVGGIIGIICLIIIYKKRVKIKL